MSCRMTIKFDEELYKKLRECAHIYNKTKVCIVRDGIKKEVDKLLKEHEKSGK